jgi:hypothetical protein
VHGRAFSRPATQARGRRAVSSGMNGARPGEILVFGFALSWPIAQLAAALL